MYIQKNEIGLLTGVIMNIDTDLQCAPGMILVGLSFWNDKSEICPVIHNRPITSSPVGGVSSVCGTGH